MKFVQKTMSELLKLKYPDIEYIYIDNGSTDGTIEYVRQATKSSDRDIKLIENGRNLGVSVAKNRAVAAAKGDYLLLLADDMLVENPDFLSNLIEFHKTLDRPGIVMPFFVDIEEFKDGKTWSYGTYYYLFGIMKKKRRIDYRKVLACKGPIEIAIGQGGAIFTTRTVWDDLGGFDESQLFNLDDDDLSTRALVYGYRNYLYNGEYIVHLGLVKRKDPKRYANNDRTYFSGKAKPILKNFNWFTILWMMFFFSGKAVAEAIWHSITMMYPGIFFANIYSMFVFIRDLPDTLRKRAIVQKNRKTDDAYILSLKAPNY
jgi:GT2 family glycosyltransferase